MWSNDESDLPDDLKVLLVDPTLKQLCDELQNVSEKLRHTYQNEFGLDFYFAGHGEESTGDLVLRDGVLTPRMLLGLQSRHINPDETERTIGLFLDSCYSGAFLIRLAIQAFEDFSGFSLDEGLVSCLPDEQCYEMEMLQHGVFTYTHLYPGNRHVDRERFNEAILRNDTQEIAKALQGLVGMTSNAAAFLTEGQQFSMSLTKHSIDVHGGHAKAKLGSNSDFAKLANSLTAFKHSR